MRKLRVLSAVCFALMATASHATTIPVCAQHIINTDMPYGTASLHKFIFHVYDAEFWSSENGWSMEHAHALHLTYFVNIDGPDFLERTLEELKHNPDVHAQMLQEFETLLTPLYPNVVDGDSITAVYSPHEGAYLCHNGIRLGAIAPAHLVEPFFGIWLGEHTSEPDLRNALLQLKE